MLKYKQLRNSSGAPEEVGAVRLSPAGGGNILFRKIR